MKTLAEKTELRLSEVKADEARSKLAYLIFKIACITTVTALAVFVLVVVLTDDVSSGHTGVSAVLTAGLGAIVGVTSAVLSDVGRRARRRLRMSKKQPIRSGSRPNPPGAQTERRLH